MCVCVCVSVPPPPSSSPPKTPWSSLSNLSFLLPLPPLLPLWVTTVNSLGLRGPRLKERGEGGREKRVVESSAFTFRENTGLAETTYLLVVGGGKDTGCFFRRHFWSLWDSLDRLKAFHNTNKVFFSKFFFCKHESIFFLFRPPLSKKEFFSPHSSFQACRETLPTNFRNTLNASYGQLCHAQLCGGGVRRAHTPSCLHFYFPMEEGFFFFFS